MSAYLVTGNPGSGKTTVALELTRRGFIAIDTDEIAGWETAEGLAVGQPEHPTDEWLRQDRWVWRRSRLEDAIQLRTTVGHPVFLCGIAANQREMLDCFDLVFLLSLDDSTQLDRLDTASNAHRNAAQRTQIIRGRPVFELEMRAAGALVLDGRQPTSRVVDRILRGPPYVLPPVVGHADQRDHPNQSRDRAIAARPAAGANVFRSHGGDDASATRR